MRRGFSLLETTLVLFLLAILVSASAISFSSLAPKYNLHIAVWEITSRLNYARYKAILHGASRKVIFFPDGYAIERYDENEKLWRPEGRFILDGVHVASNNSPIFSPAGTVTNLATITLSNSWGGYKITIAISGRIKTTRL